MGPTPVPPRQIHVMVTLHWKLPVHSNLTMPSWHTPAQPPALLWYLLQLGLPRTGCCRPSSHVIAQAPGLHATMFQPCSEYVDNTTTAHLAHHHMRALACACQAPAGPPDDKAHVEWTTVHPQQRQIRTAAASTWCTVQPSSSHTLSVRCRTWHALERAGLLHSKLHAQDQQAQALQLAWSNATSGRVVIYRDLQHAATLQ
jgi:hypothetical protein